MRTCLAFLALLALSAVARADDAMVKVVFRQEGPKVVPGSYAALPRTLYRWQTYLGRVEQPLDPVHHVQQLYIANGRDAWIIDLLSKTGKHMYDSGVGNTSFTASIAPQSAPDAAPPARDFELGREMIFMHDHGVKPKPVTHDGKKMLLSECLVDGVTVRLYLDAATSVPLESEILKDGKLVVRLVYLEYKQLPFDPLLFGPPADVTITEAK